MARRGDADARALVDQVDDELRALPRLPRAGRPLDEEVPRAEDADEPLHLPEVTRLDRPRVRRARAGACGCLPWWPWASYFRPYDLRHTCATLLINEGRPASEVAEYLGHADSGFTARVYTHVFQDAARRRRVPITEAIVAARRDREELAG